MKHILVFTLALFTFAASVLAAPRLKDWIALSDPDAEDAEFLTGMPTAEDPWYSGKQVTFTFKIEHARHASFFEPNDEVIVALHKSRLGPSTYQFESAQLTELGNGEFQVTGVLPEVPKTDNDYRVRILFPRFGRSVYLANELAESRRFKVYKSPEDAGVSTSDFTEPSLTE